MIFFTLKTIFISLLLIALIHYLYGFFKNTLTVPKVKDLVNKPAQRYTQMFAGINNENAYTVQERNVQVDQYMKSTNEKEQSMGPQNVGGQSMGVQDRNIGGQSMGVQDRNMGVQDRNMGQQSMGQKSMQMELKNFLNELKKPNNATNVMPSTIDANNNNFPAANESAFGSYTPF